MLTQQERLQMSIEQLNRVRMKLDCIGEHEDYTGVAIRALERGKEYDALELKVKKVFGGDVFLQDIVEALLRNDENIDSHILQHKDMLELQQYKEIGGVKECKYYKDRFFSDSNATRAKDTKNNHRKQSAFTDRDMAVIGALAGIVL